jgi:DNA polymerase III alpha subunit
MANYSAIPLFKSHYSLGKSVLTLSPAGPSEKDEPSSVFNIAEKLKLKSVTLVEDSMSGFLEAYKSSQNQKVKLQFGLRLTLCDQISKKTSESRTKEHKVVIFAKNGKGYYDLIKISTIACNEGFYYYPRIDTDSLKELWSDDLMLTVPFYDSYVFKNHFTYSVCVPDFSFCKPTYLVENNNLPLDALLERKVRSAAAKDFEIFQAQSVYYEAKKDFLSYLTCRCISKRTTLNKPNLEHCSSNEFCAEAFNEKYGK